MVLTRAWRVVIAESSEVVIVGGGAAGCAIAYLLSMGGIEVTVVEKDSVAAHASGFAAGTLNPLYGAGIPGPLQPLALEGFQGHLRLWDELRAETGIDVQGRLVPMVRLAVDEEEEEELRGLESDVKGVEGFPVRWLSPEDVRGIDQRISPHVTGALMIEGIGSLDSYLFTLALARAAEKHGARFVRGTVVGLAKAGQRVSAVELADGVMPCQGVVLALGPWSSQVESWLGYPVPVYPLKGEILRLTVPGPAPEPIIGLQGHYLAWKGDGLVWTGTTEEDVGFDDGPSAAARQHILKGTVSIMPSLSGARVVRHTACLRPESRDGLPIIGPAPGWEGVYLATGGGHKGILISPAMARIISDLITTGRTQLSWSAFDPGRCVL